MIVVIVVILSWLMFLLGGILDTISRTAGSKPLAVPSQLNAVAGRLAGGKVGEENLEEGSEGQVRRGDVVWHSGH